MNIDKLKKVIQAANPEITELKFGCEVKLGKDVFTIIKMGSGDNALVWGNEMTDIYHMDVFRILGRPIRLADVLLAIEKKTRPPEKYMVCTNGILTFRESEEITAQVFNSRFLSTGVGWNLLDDNLDDQSDECKEFLTQLLVKTNSRQA